MRAMDSNIWESSTGDWWTAVIMGIICAVIKLLDIHLLADPYMIVLVKVFFTAVIGGAGGVLGKHLIGYAMKKWKEKFKKNKQP
jgi:hypothetical protein